MAAQPNTEDKIQEIEVSRIHLHHGNPRHKELSTQEEVIEQLCRDENVLDLARSICEDGMNPLEQIGVIELNKSRARRSKNTYEVWEGNRRICAVQLLNDPERAPAKLRASFKRLTRNYTPIRKVNAVVFQDKDRLLHWMENIHGGEQGGVGRKRWNAEQKERALGSNRNAVALALLDVAEGLGYITEQGRKKKLTTLTRYVLNPDMKSALGLDASSPDNPKTDLTDEDFKATLKTVIDDLVAGQITSRHNATTITQYARTLPKRSGASTDREDSRPISGFTGDGQKGSKKKKAKPAKPKFPTKVDVSEDLSDTLDKAGSHKLVHLYRSICDVSAKDHPHLIAIGSWALIESLTALVGRKEGTSFEAYYSNNQLGQLGFPKGKGLTAIRDALKRLSSGGNTTKHHATSGTFDSAQLINDMETVTPVLIASLKANAAP